MAHGNTTGIHYIGARNIFSLGRSGNGNSMDFLGRGRNCQQNFSGFKFFRSDFRRGEIKNFKQEAGPACLSTYLGPWGVHGASARATDHWPIFVHSRLVKPPLTHSAPGSGGWGRALGAKPPPPEMI